MVKTKSSDSVFHCRASSRPCYLPGIRVARNNRANGPPGGQLIGQLRLTSNCQSLDGKNLKLSDLRGKAVLLNFWATYCGPCKIEMPWFVELQKEYGPQGFQIVGVAMDDASTEDIAKFAKEMGVNYPILLGKESVGQSYGGVSVLPTTFFLDRDGKLIAPRIRVAEPQRLCGPHQKSHEPGPSGTGSEVTK